MNAGKQDAERLLAEVLPFAKRMLSDHGEFHPYGAYIKPDGAIVHVGVSIDGEEFPEGRDLVDVLKQRFRRMARHGDLRAAAVVINVQARCSDGDELGDAIQVLLEQEESYSAEVLVPYGRDQLEFGDICAREGARWLADA